MAEQLKRLQVYETPGVTVTYRIRTCAGTPASVFKGCPKYSTFATSAGCAPSLRRPTR